MVFMQRNTRHSAPPIITYLFCLFFFAAASAGAQQSKNLPITDAPDQPHDIVPAERIPLDSRISDTVIAPVLEEGHALVRQFTKALPILLLSLVIAVVVWLLARLVSRWAFSLLDRRINSLMLSRLVARLCALPILLVGIYLILNITGLNNLAATVIGGTGLLGLIIGFAFRDIAENFLASILISLQRPFRLGDTIEVLNFIGVVQAVMTRAKLSSRKGYR